MKYTTAKCPVRKSGTFRGGARDMCAVLAGKSPVVGLIGPRPSLRQLVLREEQGEGSQRQILEVTNRNLIQGHASG